VRLLRWWFGPVVPRPRREGERDDLARIHEAQRKAAKRWFRRRRVVYFPPGEYWLYDQLVVQGDVTFRGES